MPSAISDNPLVSFLLSCKEKLRHPPDHAKYILVSGNESCDLDSTSCSLAYAFFKQQKLGSSAVVLPLCNIRRQDMPLRTSSTYWLDQCGLPWRDCIYLDDLFPTETTAVCHNFTDLVLVDHYAAVGRLASMDLTVSEVIDHHHPSPEDWRTLQLLGGYKRIEPVGSCASLVTMELLCDNRFSELPAVVWKLLYGAILVDTMGLSEHGRKAGRSTELDLRAASRIEDMISDDLFACGVTRQDLFNALEAAKFNVSGLSTRDLLCRDSKMAAVPELPHLSFLCSTVSGLDFQLLLRRADFTSASSQLCGEHSARLLVGTTEGFPMDDLVADNSSPTDPGVLAAAPVTTTKVKRRGLFVFSPQGGEDAMCKELVAFLNLPSSGLMLSSEPPQHAQRDGLHYAGVIGNLKVTRKLILPLLVQFQRRWSDNQTSSNNGNSWGGPSEGDDEGSSRGPSSENLPARTDRTQAGDTEG